MYRVRRMTVADIPQVEDLERDAFPEQVPTTNFAREMEYALARYIVLEDDAVPGRLDGYAGLWMVVDEAHLLSIGVRSPLRGRGLGELLLIAALRVAVEEGGESMLLEVRVSNHVAQRLYEKYGFRRVGIRRRYYPDNGEDAALMTADGLAGEEMQERITRLAMVHYQARGPYVVELSTSG